MLERLHDLAFPLLRQLDSERAHAWAIAALRSGLASQRPIRPEPRLITRVMGLNMVSPIGLAAGFDKDACAIPGLMRLGFGSIEVGTVTRAAQRGNPRPRLFRLPEDGAVINRMGFNNRGIGPFARHFNAASRLIPLGANLGLNRDVADPLADYSFVANAVADRADWITINVSSPNTPGLRELQSPVQIGAILRAVRAALPTHPPLLVKLAPDLHDATLPDIVEACIEAGASGLILTNTTVARPPGLRGPYAAETGGLSGRPLFARSTAMLALVAGLARGRLVLVGVGGIATGEDVLAKLRAGASFVQLYTAFALQGPSLVRRLHAELLAALERGGFADVARAVGTGT